MTIALLIVIVIALAINRHQDRKQYVHVCAMLDHLDGRLQIIEKRLHDRFPTTEETEKAINDEVRKLGGVPDA